MVVNNCVDCDKEIETIDLRCEQCRLARYEWLLAEQEAEKEAILTKMQEIKEEAYE